MRFRRILRLGLRYLPALMEALANVALFRTALLFFKYRQIAERIALNKPDARNSETTPIVLAWAVKQAARIVPFATCLTQALSLQRMLARRGLSSVIRVGVKIDAKAELDAHAWVTLDERVLLGGEDRNLSEYKVLTSLGVQPHA